MTISDTIAQVEALEAKATPKNWGMTVSNIGTHITKADIWCGDVSSHRSNQHSDNAALIVALRNAAPGIIAYIRALEKQLADMTSREAVERACAAIHPLWPSYLPDSQAEIMRDMQDAIAAAREAGK